VSSKAGILLFLPLLAVGLVSFVVVRSQQGEGGTLIVRQQQAEALTAGKLEGVVRVAPESANGPPGKSAICKPLGSGELKNPWRCTIRYASGRVIQYRVIVHANGSYTADDQVAYYQGRRITGTGQIRGCCINVP
jgi:hypothetical protein